MKKYLLPMLLMALMLLAWPASAEELRVESDAFQVAYGYRVTLPTVYDEAGKTVSVTWKITYEAGDTGNPGKYAFRIVNKNQVQCYWPSGVCIVTGTAKSGATVKVNVFAYRMADKIGFRQEEYLAAVGESVPTVIRIIESAGDLTGDLIWTIGDESVISLDEESFRIGVPAVIGLKPGTTTLRATMANGKYAQCTVRVITSKYIPGDVNVDGRVDLTDAVELLRYMHGPWENINMANAEVNGDHLVDEKDAMLILQYLAGWNVSLQ